MWRGYTYNFVYVYRLVWVSFQTIVKLFSDNIGLQGLYLYAEWQDGFSNLAYVLIGL